MEARLGTEDVGPVEFTDRACHAFGLGQPSSVRRLPRGGNVVWDITTARGRFVVKELPPERFADLVSGSEFELAAFRACVVPMAEPCFDVHGRLIGQMQGSRDHPVCVRVHRFQLGEVPTRPVSAEIAREAGSSLAGLQDFAFQVQSRFHLPERIWRSPDIDLLAEFDDVWGLPRSVVARASDALQRAELLIGQWADSEPMLLPAHCDHKPENALLAGRDLVILDWDEVAACDPRIEAVEAALRWAWTDSGPRPLEFASFVQGYQDAGRPLGIVKECDWAKWVAGIASWFEFQAAGSLGRWASVSSPSEDALRGALDTISHLIETLDQLPIRTQQLNEALNRLVA